MKIQLHGFVEFEKYKEIAKEVDAYLMADIAHPSGLIAAGSHPSPVPYCDVITSTTHKTLAGPRSGMIFYKKKYENDINFSVFPGIQGGPHQNQIGALCFQLKYINTKEFKNYIIQVKKNAKTMAEEMFDNL